MSLVNNLRCFGKKQCFSSLVSAHSENVLFKSSTFFKNRIQERNFFASQKSKFYALKSYSFRLSSLFIHSKFVKVPGSVHRNTRTFFESTGTEINTNVSKDVLLYDYTNDRFFKILKYFGGSQFLLWGYLANTSHTTLKDSPVIDDGQRELRWWEKVNLGENWIRNGITTICVLMGASLTFFPAVLSSRTVKSIVLHKGGRAITITTYSFLTNSKLTVPLALVSSSVSRTTNAQNFPIKIKGKWLYYMLDKKGTFLHPALFDWTVGLKRKI